MRTVDNVIRALSKPSISQISAPVYIPTVADSDRRRVGFAVSSMKDHMTDEGYQIFQGLEYSGYNLVGHGFTGNYTNTSEILSRFIPNTAVVQDKREWEGYTAGGPDKFDERERFTNIGLLKDRSDIFKVTILKDAHQKPGYHNDAAIEMGCHAWIVYYHPTIVNHLAPYTRPQHLVRTYHSLNRDIVPPFISQRKGCLLSGALSSVYPLRQRMITSHHLLPDCDYLPHPGYHKKGCSTQKYLQTLNRYKVAICTSSIYGYALRKIIEATACGCVVVTDLPTDEVLPEIDGNLIRVGSDKQPRQMGDLLREIYSQYSPERQQHFSHLAKTHYDYRAIGLKLSQDIERLRLTYNQAPNPYIPDHI